MLEIIGYWVEEDQGGLSPFPCPSDFVNTAWDPNLKDKIVTYLESGHILFEYMGYSYCRFRCGIDEPSMGSRELTDGQWAWPEGLVHYIQFHDVMLPEEFICDARSRDFKMPEFVDVKALQEEPISSQFWIKWSSGGLRPPSPPPVRDGG